MSSPAALIHTYTLLLPISVPRSPSLCLLGVRLGGVRGGRDGEEKRTFTIHLGRSQDCLICKWAVSYTIRPISASGP